MQTNLCENDWYLRENEILKGYVEDDDFYLAFGHWYEEDKGDYNCYILAVMDSWYQNELDTEDIPIINELALSAIEAACEIITGENLASVAEDGQWSIKLMVSELVGEV
jgi:hypothetical protein